MLTALESLILVFARLVLKQAKDVVDFLAGLTIGDVNGLQIVLGAWLENSSSFSGYEEIRQKYALPSIFDKQVLILELQCHRTIITIPPTGS
jgi:hypothetical protein